MKKRENSMLFSSLLLITLVIFSSGFLSAEEIPNWQNEYVNDFAGIFNPVQIASLQSELYQVRQNTTAQIVVVSIVDCTGDYDKYAVDLGNQWAIGTKEKRNGLLILYCLNVKKLVIKSGYGLEGILPDSKIGRLLDDYYVPLRDQNKTAEGIILVTNEFTKIAYENAEEIMSGKTSFSDNSVSIIFFIILAVFFFFLITIIIKNKVQQKNKKFSKAEKDKKTGKKIWGILYGFGLFLLFIFIASGIFYFLIGALIFIIISRIFGGAQAARTGSHAGFFGSSGFGGSGGFSGGGGGFGGGSFGGGGASR